MTVYAHWEVLEAYARADNRPEAEIRAMRAVFYAGSTSVTNICRHLIRQVRDGKITADAAIWTLVDLDEEVEAYFKPKN